MSPARQHRDRFANQAKPDPHHMIASASEGGHKPATPFIDPSPAMLHRMERAAQVLASATAMAGEHAAPDRGTPEERTAAQIRLRLQHDLRRLKEIASIERKIAAKREMLPEYAAWVDGLVAADNGVNEDVLPTIMVWRIDVGDFEGALSLAGHVLKHQIPLPARYERSAPALIVEEIADAALKAQRANDAFPLEILTRVEVLTADDDMHDEIRAKLSKAIGTEQVRVSEDDSIEPLARTIMAGTALQTLRRAQQLHDRVGVKGQIQKLEKLLAPPKDPAASAA